MPLTKVPFTVLILGNKENVALPQPPASTAGNAMLYNSCEVLFERFEPENWGRRVATALSLCRVGFPLSLNAALYAEGRLPLDPFYGMEGKLVSLVGALVLAYFRLVYVSLRTSQVTSAAALLHHRNSESSVYYSLPRNDPAAA